MKVEALVFDLGGTLMEYKGFPLYWGDFYEQSFNNVNEELKLNISKEQIRTAINKLIEYNPRINPREIEYTANHIFREAVKSWEMNPEIINEIIICFFKPFRRNVAVFPDTIDILEHVRSKEYKIGVLTDVPTGMPGYLIREDMAPIIHLVDDVVTSDECGFRKPNKAGIEILSKKYGVPIQSIAFIGDEEKDVLTARNAGAIPIFLNRQQVQRSTGECIQITTLAELKDFV